MRNMISRIINAIGFAASRKESLGNRIHFHRSENYVNNGKDINDILNLVDGFRCSKVLFTAVELKLFDHLSLQSLSLDELTHTLNTTDSLALERFLNGCIVLKLIRQNRMTNKYTNTELSEKYLRWKSPLTLTGFIHLNDQSTYSMWKNLSNRMYRKAKEDPFTFDQVYVDENIERIFVSGMHGLGLNSFPSIIKSLDHGNKYPIFCDVGGGTGSLAISACEFHPQLKSIIFDLPRVEKHAHRYLNEIPLQIRRRIHFHSGDFFVDPLPKADLYGLGRILHDWNDEQCQQILTKIYQTLPRKNGAILIAEKLLNDDKIGPLQANMQDINMLLATNGKERTSKEYTDMLENTGFRHIRCQRTGTYLDAIIGYK